ncbi:hypothetical protein ANTPLA_LOCUS8928 [Anthophora plagiata]
MSQGNVINAFQEPNKPPRRKKINPQPNLKAIRQKNRNRDVSQTEDENSMTECASEITGTESEACNIQNLQEMIQDLIQEMRALREENRALKEQLAEQVNIIANTTQGTSQGKETDNATKESKSQVTSWKQSITQHHLLQLRKDNQQEAATKQRQIPESRREETVLQRSPPIYIEDEAAHSTINLMNANNVSNFSIKNSDATGQYSVPEDTEKENLYCNNLNTRRYPATYRGCQYIKDRRASNKIKQKQVLKDSKPTEHNNATALLNTITKEMNKRNTNRKHMTYS